MLGNSHDLALLQAYLGSGEDTDQQLLEQVRARKEELYAEAVKTGRQVFTVPVSDLVADLSSYWADQRNSMRRRGSQDSHI